MFFKELIPKAGRVFIYWLISYCIAIILQRFLFVLAAMYMGYSFQVGPLNPLIFSGAYQYSLPLMVVLMIPIYYYSSYFFFYDSDYENPKEIKQQALQLTITFFLLSILGDLVIWVFLPWPMSVELLDYFKGTGIWNFGKYVTVAIGSFLGARPFYLRKSKLWDENIDIPTLRD